MTSGGHFAAIVLAGGQSTRFGRDKASVELRGRTLLQRVIDRLDGIVDEYLVVKAAGQELPPVFASRPINVLEDATPGAGPLGGVHTGLAAMSADSGIAVACDMPLIRPALIALLRRLHAGHDATVPMRDGLPEPLCAVYGKSCAEAIEAEMRAGNLKMTGFLEAVDVRYVEPSEWQRPDADGVSFFNVNTEEDLQRAESLL
jgi:molybdopterin-guanine dinucleotide biosynthesis protein A